MANTKSAAKRARQTKRRTATNKRIVTGLKSVLKTAREAITGGIKDTAKAGVKKAASTLDRAAKSGRIHRNKANRTKSRMAKALAALK